MSGKKGLLDPPGRVFAAIAQFTKLRPAARGRGDMVRPSAASGLSSVQEGGLVEKPRDCGAYWYDNFFGG